MLLEHSYSFCNGNGVFTNTVILEAVATALDMIFVDRTFHLPVFGVPRCHLKGISDFFTQTSACVVMGDRGYFVESRNDAIEVKKKL